MGRFGALRLGVDMLRTLAVTRRPDPGGVGIFDHSQLSTVLRGLATNGVASSAGVFSDLEGYLESVATVDPDLLTRDEALAFWINLYNAVAVKLAAEAFRSGKSSVLRVPGAFTRAEITIAGESLSLNSIEHGKVRRFGDPRIHAALVCGSLSCPTLRSAPYAGHDLNSALEAQMTSFLADGGAKAGDDDDLVLSRIFSWYGADFVRPSRMPSLLPVSPRRTLDAIRPWLPERLRYRRNVRFQQYDWSLACTVG